MRRINRKSIKTHCKSHRVFAAPALHCFAAGMYTLLAAYLMSPELDKNPVPQDGRSGFRRGGSLVTEACLFSSD